MGRHRAHPRGEGFALPAFACVFRRRQRTGAFEAKKAPCRDLKRRKFMFRTMSQMQRPRRHALLAIAAAVSMCVLGTAPAMAAPQTINVVDVAGNLALTQDAFELYAKK